MCINADLDLLFNKYDQIMDPERFFSFFLHISLLPVKRQAQGNRISHQAECNQFSSFIFFFFFFCILNSRKASELKKLQTCQICCTHIFLLYIFTSTRFRFNCSWNSTYSVHCTVHTTYYAVIMYGPKRACSFHEKYCAYVNLI